MPQLDPIGVFVVNMSWLGDRYRKLLPVFRDMVIVRAEAMYYNYLVEYQALGDMFCRPDGTDVQRYDCLVQQNSMAEIVQVKFEVHQPGRQIEYKWDSDTNSTRPVDGWRLLRDRY